MTVRSVIYPHLMPGLYNIEPPKTLTITCDSIFSLASVLDGRASGILPAIFQNIHDPIWRGHFTAHLVHYIQKCKNGQTRPRIVCLTMVGILYFCSFMCLWLSILWYLSWTWYKFSLEVLVCYRVLHFTLAPISANRMADWKIPKLAGSCLTPLGHPWRRPSDNIF